MSEELPLEEFKLPGQEALLRVIDKGENEGFLLVVQYPHYANRIELTRSDLSQLHKWLTPRLPQPPKKKAK